MSNLLTDEEMQKLFDLAYYKNQAYSAGMTQEPCEPEDLMNKVAKAQAKKLVIAISENSHMGDKYLNVNPQWWQDLQKEVEEKPPFSVGCGGDS